MPGDVTTLQRLLFEKAVGDLFKTFFPLIADQSIGLIDYSGRMIAGVDRSPDRKFFDQITIPPLTDKASQEDLSTYVLYGKHYSPVIIENNIIGFILAQFPSPAIPVIQNTLHSFLIQLIEKKRLAEETLDRYRELSLLYRITQTIGASLDPEEILQNVVLEALRIIQADSWATILWDRSNIWVSSSNTLHENRAFRLVNELKTKLNESLSTEKASEFVTKSLNINQETSTILCSPLKTNDLFLGMICLARTHTQDGEFRSEDQKLLLSLADQASIAIAKARLHQREIERQKVEQELLIGQKIQKSLLPDKIPLIQGWDLAAEYRAASLIGGDFYDISPVSVTDWNPNRYWGITIADVTGKGIPAALLMASSLSVLKGIAANELQPETVLEKVNRLTFQNQRSGLFMTAFYLILDTSESTIRFSNGGHEPALWYSKQKKTLTELDCNGSMLIGVNPHVQYTGQTVRIEPGDTILLYTDGITEARDPEGAFYSEERLHSILTTCCNLSSSDLLQAILNDVENFLAGKPQSDDLTLVVIKREK